MLLAALGAIYVSIPVIIISVISIAVSIPVLIASSKNKKPQLLLPWLIFNVTTLIFGIGYAIYVTIAVILPENVITGLVYFFIILIAFGGFFFKQLYKFLKINYIIILWAQHLASIFGWSSTITIDT